MGDFISRPYRTLQVSPKPVILTHYQQPIGRSLAQFKAQPTDPGPTLYSVTPKFYLRHESQRRAGMPGAPA